MSTPKSAAAAAPAVVPPLLYSVPQAARVLSISPRLLWEFIARGELKTRLIGRRRLVPRRELEKFAARDHA